ASAGYSHESAQLLFVADSSGRVWPLTIGPPTWTWMWHDSIAEHPGIVGLAAYFHPGDGRHHCFIAQDSGDIWEVAFTSLDDQTTLQELWLGRRESGARGIGGFSGGVNGTQHLYVCGNDGRLSPLEL